MYVLIIIYEIFKVCRLGKNWPGSVVEKEENENDLRHIYNMYLILSIIIYNPSPNEKWTDSR